MTNPAPFHFHETKKKTEDSSARPFVSLAEQVLFFQKGTPKRFRTSRSSERRSHDDIGVHYRLTQALTPNLTAVHRHRPVTALSREEQEMKELEEAQRHKFKANPVNEKILKPNGAKPQRPLSREITVPEPFHLTEVHRKEVAVEEESREFHARPVPKSVLEGPPVLPKKEHPVTVPQSPAFASKNLPRRSKKSESEDEGFSSGPYRMKRTQSVDRNLQRKFGSTNSLGSCSSKDSGSSGIPAKRPPTTIEPFKVEERSKEMIAKREEKIKKMLDEEKKAREFHAHPLPRLDKVIGLPEKSTILTTVQKPFHLASDERSEKYREKINQKMEEEQKRARAEAEFHARPATVLQKEQFKPEPARKPLTELKPFKLNSDERSKQREQFDLWIKEKEAEIEAARRQAEQRKLEQEKEEVARLRQQMTTKANPVPQYKPFVPQPSQKALTSAKSPNFTGKVKKEKENS